MLINYFRHCLLFGVFVPCFGDLMNLTTYTNESLARREREVGTKYLIFPQGSNVQLVYCLTVGTYAKPQGIFTVGVTAGLAWELPHRNTVPYRKPAEVYHRRSRRELYRKVELMLKTRRTARPVSSRRSARLPGVSARTWEKELLSKKFYTPYSVCPEDGSTSIR
ncbi:uncharacterized protein LOC109857173 isoform X2 [Pseudomyrmex gracilis]|uniref:uncharacterized protein LOC109857173 isoform X2 n=1 Tax=Pseudomyrmex gracilis TaxID=219809 RepID=UPI000994D781|nr:uncharacterized protein LOC109857173 isoform X2 [Pseudomyrmex gracilis]